jgi:hypothetical protein
MPLPTKEDVLSQLKTTQGSVEGYLMGGHMDKAEKIIPILSALAGLTTLTHYIGQGKSQGELYLQMTYISDNLKTLASNLVSMKGGKKTRGKTRRLRRNHK